MSSISRCNCLLPTTLHPQVKFRLKSDNAVVQASEGIEALRRNVDTLIVIPNDR